jgi:CRP/FNR family transcriptional regulator
MRLLAELDGTTLQLLAEQATTVHYAPSTVISLAGEACARVCFVHRGVVQARQDSADGREYVLAHLGAGACFDLIPALDGGATLATIVALTAVTAYAIPCGALNSVLLQDGPFAARMAVHLAGEVRRLAYMSRDLALHTVRMRLARFLLDQADALPGEHRWTQDLIAAHVGTVRDVVGRLLREFAAEGLVQGGRGRLAIVDRQGLEEVARGAS